MERKRKILSAVLLFLLCMILWKAFAHRPVKERECRATDDTCQAGYLLNLDGMKGLGYSALLLMDDEMRQYNKNEQKLTPKGNYKNICTCLSDVWGIAELGEDSLVEKLLDL